MRLRTSVIRVLLALAASSCGTSPGESNATSAIADATATTDTAAIDTATTDTAGSAGHDTQDDSTVVDAMIGQADSLDEVDAAIEDTAADDAVTVPPYPLDDSLRVNQLQCSGTHNSYHVAPPPEQLIPDWDYTQPPLAEQLGLDGARSFELDLYHEGDGSLRVVHIPFLDPGTTCDTLAVCLSQIRGWSEAHPGHHPLFIMLELKETVDIGSWIDALEQTIDDGLGAARVVHPDEVRKDKASLREAVTTLGWPTLGETRGRVFVIVMNDSHFVDAWRDGHPAGAGRNVFIHMPIDDPDAAFVKYDDPTDPAIPDVVKAGFIVRTRADEVPGTPEDDGLYQSVEALASGAQMISTDHLRPRKTGPYSFAIPGGAPSRCNPINAPIDCTSDDIESPDRLGGN